ncbi:MAG: hypothetical protein ITF98_05160 [Fermentimonas sp.]|nr:hypothetical protein [Fermentimonas sp.]
MKSFRLIQLSVLVIFTVGTIQNISAESIESSSNKEVITIKSTRFAIPLVEKWANEYEKVYPGVDIVIANSKDLKDAADLSLESLIGFDDSNKKEDNLINAARFALLPISNSENPYLKELNKKRLNSKGIRELFFENGEFGESTDSKKKLDYEVTIYSGNNSDSFAEAFASHFGYIKADLKGRKISGDDIFLIDAIQKDNEGITFNNLSYIFDINTRSLKNGVAIIPLDIRKDQREILEEADVDKTITLLENEKIPLIPIENIGFISESNNPEAEKFIEWVLSEGQKYNREFGFLKAEYEQLANN